MYQEDDDEFLSETYDDASVYSRNQLRDRIARLEKDEERFAAAALKLSEFGSPHFDEPEDLSVTLDQSSESDSYVSSRNKALRHKFQDNAPELRISHEIPRMHIGMQNMHRMDDEATVRPYDRSSKSERKLVSVVDELRKTVTKQQDKLARAELVIAALEQRLLGAERGLRKIKGKSAIRDWKAQLQDRALASDEQEISRGKDEQKHRLSSINQLFQETLSTEQHFRNASKAMTRPESKRAPCSSKSRQKNMPPFLIGGNSSSTLNNHSFLSKSNSSSYVTALRKEKAELEGKYRGILREELGGNVAGRLRLILHQLDEIDERIRSVKE